MWWLGGWSVAAESVVVRGVRVVVWWLGFVCGGGLCVAERGRGGSRERERRRVGESDREVGFQRVIPRVKTSPPDFVRFWSDLEREREREIFFKIA